MSCVFCDVAADQIVVASELAYAMRDHFPVNPGHTLLIPRRHVETWFEASRDEQRPRLRVVEGGGALAEKKRVDRVWVGIIGGTLAAAAAILLILAIPRDPGPEQPSDPITENVAPEPGSEIEDVDFGYSTGAIFQVEGQEGTQYAVIWISDEKVEYTIDVRDEAEERIQ